MVKNKTELKKKILEEVMDIPKLSLALGGIGILIIIISFITLQNPFFLVTGVFAGIVFIFWGYDYWHKKLIDLKVKNLSERVDSLVYPPQ